MTNNFQFLDEKGGGLMGLSSGGGSVESAYHPSVQDLLDFVRQCALPDPHQVIMLHI